MFKQWFNQIDILKRWKYIEDNTLEWYTRKYTGRLFKFWRRHARLRKIKYLLLKQFQTNQKFEIIQSLKKNVEVRLNFKLLSERRIVRMEQKYFREWLQMLVSSNSMKKLRFQRNSKALLKRTSFRAWKVFVQTRRNFK